MEVYRREELLYVTFIPCGQRLHLLLVLRVIFDTLIIGSVGQEDNSTILYTVIVTLSSFPDTDASSSTAALVIESPLSRLNFSCSSPLLAVPRQE